MSDPRILGLTLMAISIVTFLGSTWGSLPAVSLFPALGLFAVGAFEFLRTNHEEMAKAERRAQRAVNNPRIRENPHIRTLGDVDEALVDTSDVCLPLEVQTGEALADRLGKPNQLLEKSVLTEEEYALAKARLLS